MAWSSETEEMMPTFQPFFLGARRGLVADLGVCIHADDAGLGLVPLAIAVAAEAESGMTNAQVIGRVMP